MHGFVNPNWKPHGFNTPVEPMEIKRPVQVQVQLPPVEEQASTSTTEPPASQPVKESTPPRTRR